MLIGAVNWNSYSFMFKKLELENYLKVKSDL